MKAVAVASPMFQGVFFGGAKGSRTPDLLPARQLLYQLSYGPEVVSCAARV